MSTNSNTLLLEAVRMCYFKYNQKYDHHSGDKNNNCQSHLKSGDKFATIAIASSLSDYFDSLFDQLSDNIDLSPEGFGYATVSAETLSTLLNLLSLKKPKHYQPAYRYSQFCFTILEQYYRTYHSSFSSDKPLIMKKYYSSKIFSSSFILKSFFNYGNNEEENFQRFIDDLLNIACEKRSSDHTDDSSVNRINDKNGTGHANTLQSIYANWRWKTLEKLSVRFWRQKILSASTIIIAADHGNGKNDDTALAELTALKQMAVMREIEVENLARQLDSSLRENEQMKSVCRNLCAQIRRADAQFLALCVKTSNNRQQNLTSLPPAPQNTIWTDSGYAERLKRHMGTISRRMKRVRQTLIEARPFVQHLEELAAKIKQHASSKNRKKKNRENTNKSCPTATAADFTLNTISCTDSGWISDDEQQYSEQMTNSCTSDNFNENTSNDDELLDTTAPSTLESRFRMKLDPPTTVDSNHIQIHNHNRNQIQANPQNQFYHDSPSPSFVHKKSTFKDDYCPSYSSSSDSEKDEVTKELNEKLNSISRRLHEAEYKLYRVLIQQQQDFDDA